MTNFQPRLRNTRIYPLLIFVAVVNMFCVLPRLSGATAPDLTISVVNNSQKEIRHVFLASAGSENWGDDLLSEPIAAGTGRNLNASWNESTVKVVAEDEDGCFLTSTVAGTGNPNWTITTSTARNCGN